MKIGEYQQIKIKQRKKGHERDEEVTVYVGGNIKKCVVPDVKGKDT